MENSNPKERKTEIAHRDCEKLKTRSERQRVKMEFIRELVAKELGSSDHSLSLDDDRITAILSTFKTPTHPPYALMINRAIEELNEERGSSQKAISEFITKTHENLPLAHEAILKHHLNNLREKGEIICTDNELYIIAANSTEEKDSVATKRKKRKRGREKGIGIVKLMSKPRKESNVGEENIVERNSTKSDNGVVSNEEKLQSSEEVPEPKKPRLTLQQKYDQSELQRRKLRSHARLSIEPETAIIISEPLLFSEHEPDTTANQHRDEPPLKRCGGRAQAGPATPAVRRVLRSNSKAATSETAIVVYEPAPMPPPEKRDGRGRPRKPNTKAVLLWDPREGPEKKRDGRGRPRKLKVTATTATEAVSPWAPQDGAGEEKKKKKRDGRGRPRKVVPAAGSRVPREGLEKKRDGRGRPRKPTMEEKPSPGAAGSPWVPQEGAERRDGRGRPRKLTMEEKPSPGAAGSPWVPQEGAGRRDGRGRPRKVASSAGTEMTVFKPWDGKRGRPPTSGGGRLTRARLKATGNGSLEG